MWKIKDLREKCHGGGLGIPREILTKCETRWLNGLER